MMLLLFDDNPAKRFYCLVIDVGQFTNLLTHMPQHNPLDRHGRSGDRLASCYAGDSSEEKASQPAPKIAPATVAVTALQLSIEERAMPSFMSEKMVEFLQHVRSTPAREPSLRQIDAHCTMLACMIDSDDAIAKRLALVQSRIQSHAASIAA